MTTSLHEKRIPIIHEICVMCTSGNSWPRTNAEPPVPVPMSRIVSTPCTGFSSIYNFLSLPEKINLKIDSR